jgi:hypothetical protein
MVVFAVLRLTRGEEDPGESRGQRSRDQIHLFAAWRALAAPIPCCRSSPDEET